VPAVAAEATPLVAFTSPVSVALLMSLPVVPSKRASSEATADEGPTTSPEPPPPLGVAQTR
jgi:hypothetical protein